jgi:uncharacterized delta-60 repeat protein
MFLTSVNGSNSLAESGWMMRLWWSQQSKYKPMNNNYSKRKSRSGRKEFRAKLQVEALESRTLLNAGVLDPTFGSGGVLRETGFAYHASDVNGTGFHSVATQADGKVVVAGAANGASPGVFTLSRFNVDGSPDVVFNGKVIAQTPHFSPGSTDTADAVAVQANGQIVVAGSTLAGGVGHFAVTRYNADGTLDTTFGNAGHVVVIYLTDNAATSVSTMAIEADGRILVGGTSGSDFAVARMYTDGQEDSDFNATGKQELNIGATISAGVFVSTDVLTDIGVQSDGKIVAVGWTNIRNDGKGLDLANNFGIVRFNTDGTLDRRFRGGGAVSDDLSLTPYGLSGFSPFEDRAYSVAFQLDGKILVAGMSRFQSNGSGQNKHEDNFAVIRLNTDGSYDNTFTPDGVVITDISTNFGTGSENQANSVSVEADGKILLTGFTFINPAGLLGTTENMAMTRYNPDGTLDQNFGVHGKVVTDLSGNGTDNVGDQVLPLSGGQILVVGATGDNPNASLVLSRYVGLTPGTVQFSSATYSVAENGGSATLTVTRIGGSDGTATVSYATTSGTAVAGTDYTPAVGTVTLLPGQTSASFTVAVKDDGVFQTANKTLSVTLSNLTGGPTFGTPTTAVLTLVEADTPNSTGGTGTTSGPALTPNQKFVAQAYLDLLSRPVDPTGLSVFANFLNAGGSRQAVASAIESSGEYRADEVQALYQQYLHRPADTGGLGIFSSFLASGGTREQVATILIGSPEYFQNRGGGTNDGFLNALYGDALNRAPDLAGRTQFDAALASGTTTGQIAALILSSTEYKTDLVQSYYQRFLHRSADAGGLAFFVGLLGISSGNQQPIFVSDPLSQFQSQPPRDEDIIAMLVGSQEYFIRATS